MRIYINYVSVINLTRITEVKFYEIHVIYKQSYVTYFVLLWYTSDQIFFLEK